MAGGGQSQQDKIQQQMGKMNPQTLAQIALMQQGAQMMQPQMQGQMAPQMMHHPAMGGQVPPPPMPGPPVPGQMPGAMGQGQMGQMGQGQLTPAMINQLLARQSGLMGNGGQ